MTLQTLDREGLAEADLPMAALAHAMRLPSDWELIPGEIARLSQLLRAAIQHVEAQCAHAIVSRTFTLGGPAVGGPDVTLRLRPVRAVIVMEVGRRAVTPGDVFVSDCAGQTVLTLPFAVMAGTPLRLTVRAGYPDWETVPAGLQGAVIAKAQAFAGEAGERTGDLARSLLAPFRAVRLRGMR